MKSSVYELKAFLAECVCVYSHYTHLLKNILIKEEMD